MTAISETIALRPVAPSRRRGVSRGRWLVVAAAFAASGFLMIPVYWLLVTSIRRPAELQVATTLWPTSPYWKGYVDVLQDAGIAHNLLNSLVYGVGALVVGGVLGSGVAYAIARSRSRWSRAVLFGMLVLQTFPGIMMALPLFVLFSQIGLVNSPVAVIIALGTKTVPFSALMLRPYFAAVPVEVEQAAAVDGCTRLQAMTRVVLPLALPGIVTVCAFNFVTGWSDLLFSYTLLTDQNLQPISVGLYKYMGQYGIDWNQLMAASVIAAVPSILVFLFAQRFLISGVMAGATNE
ncbi:carbohydrate ABC transporter permease [Amnibacterium sp.]|uniref:carbohydrate ABC transporter permease n=1 Tax=Amnibacterium sp. TaxID=1872496 RepID=UPI0026291411|nr:carbohydrate ABC transporter permease [Amnibacterium sp.]MCU1474839.1 ycjP 2 [Amnibacterium sp.]